MLSVFETCLQNKGSFSYLLSLKNCVQQEFKVSFLLYCSISFINSKKKKTYFTSNVLTFNINIPLSLTFLNLTFINTKTCIKNHKS
jgi:hypothetical protein